MSYADNSTAEEFGPYFTVEVYHEVAGFHFWLSAFASIWSSSHSWSTLHWIMRYLVKARIKTGRKDALVDALERGTLGRGSVAGDEYAHNMQAARLNPDETATWVETCFCSTPLEEERAYWEEYFDLLSIKDAHNRKNCRHENGSEPWACCDCDCTRRLEAHLNSSGRPFLEWLQTPKRQ